MSRRSLSEPYELAGTTCLGTHHIRKSYSNKHHYFQSPTRASPRSGGHPRSSQFPRSIRSVVDPGSVVPVLSFAGLGGSHILTHGSPTVQHIFHPRNSNDLRGPPLPTRPVTHRRSSESLDPLASRNVPLAVPLQLGFWIHGKIGMGCKNDV
jgi:hypothetical protein